MTDGKFEAACEGCGKVWRVPSAERDYQCRECGGRVVARSADDAPEPKRQSSAPTPRTSRGRGPARPGSGRQRVSAEQRRDDGVEFRQTKGIITFLKIGFAVTAAFSGLILALLFAVYRVASEEDLFSEDAPTAQPLGLLILIFVAIYGTMFLASVVGFFRARMEPFFWCVVVAAVVFVASALALVTGTIGIPHAVAILAACLLLVFGNRLSNVLKRNPEIRARFEGRYTGEVARKSRDLSRQSTRRAAMILCGIVGAAITVGALVYFATKPTSIESRADDFREAWNQSRAEAATAFCATPKFGDKMYKSMSNRDWVKKRPSLSAPKIESEGNRRIVEFALGEETFMTSWVLYEGEWSISRFQMPRTAGGEVQDLEPQIRSFISAWNLSNPEMLARFRKDDKREKAAEGWRKRAAKRGWGRKYPRANGKFRVEDKQRTKWVYFETEIGEVRTTWYTAGNRWLLSRKVVIPDDS